MKIPRGLVSGGKGKLLVAVLVLLVLLTLLPIALQFSLRYWIDKSGLGLAHIADVDLNLFAGTLQIESLDLEQNQEVTLVIGRLYLNYGWVGLGLTEFELEELSLEDSRLVIRENEEGVWTVIIPLNAVGDEVEDTGELKQQEIELPKLFAQQINFKNVEFDVISKTVNGVLKIDSLGLQRLSTFSEEPSFLKIAASWNGAPIAIDLTAAFDGKNRTLEGEFQMSDFKLLEVMPFVKEQLQQLDGKANATFAVQATRTPANEYTFIFDGRLDIHQLGLEYQPLLANLDSLSWQGSVAVDFAEELDQFKHQANLSAQSLKVTQKGKDLEVAALESLVLSGLLIDDQQEIEFTSLQLKQLDLFRPGKNPLSWLRTGELTVENLSFNKSQQLAMETISIKDGQYLVTMDADGQLPFQSIIEDLMPAPAPAADEESAPEADAQATNDTFSYSLGKFQVLGDSYVAFENGQFTPALTTKLTIDKFDVEGIAPAQPDNKTLLGVAAHLDEFSKITIDGWLKPFSPGRDAQIKGAIEAIELPPFSPYSEAAVGYHISTGHFDDIFELEIEEKQLAMTNKLKLRKFEIEEVDKEKSEQLSSTMGMPLGLGLSLLRDSDDNIELDLPVNGPLDDPNLKINTLVAQAMGQAMGKASITFLKYAIQPYGLIVASGELLNSQWDSLDLQPVVFEPGIETLSASQAPYMKKLAELLKSRDGLAIKLCGVASVTDKASLSAVTPENPTPAPVSDEQLTALAKARGVAVKRYLVEQAVDGSRLTLCKPQINNETFSGVRISL